MLPLSILKNDAVKISIRLLRLFIVNVIFKIHVVNYYHKFEDHVYLFVHVKESTVRSKYNCN